MGTSKNRHRSSAARICSANDSGLFPSNSVLFTPKMPATESHSNFSRSPYAGDEGGIVCHLVPLGEKQALFISLTHVRVPRSMPLAQAVADYQKHRVKKLKKQGGT